MGVGHDLVIGKAAELVADHFKIVLKAGCAKCGDAFAFLHQDAQTGAGGFGIALLGQGLNGGIHHHALVLLA